MFNLQADSSMTQQIPTLHTLTFLFSDLSYGYHFSEALVSGKTLLKGISFDQFLIKFIPKNERYAIMHVDYKVLKNLGYNLLITP